MLSARLVGQTLLLFSLLDFPAAAAQVWVGTGRITQGIGRGGLVELKLTTDRPIVHDGETVRSLHGPQLNGKIQAGSIHNKIGTWHIQQCSSELCVILDRTNPKQTIFYRLYQQ